MSLSYNFWIYICSITFKSFLLNIFRFNFFIKLWVDKDHKTIIDMLRYNRGRLFTILFCKNNLFSANFCDVAYFWCRSEFVVYIWTVFLAGVDEANLRKWVLFDTSGSKWLWSCPRRCSLSGINPKSWFLPYYTSLPKQQTKSWLVSPLNGIFGIRCH